MHSRTEVNVKKSFPNFVSNKVIKPLLKKGPYLACLPSKLLPPKVTESTIKLVLTKLLDTALQDEELDFLQDKWLKVSVSDADLCFQLSLSEQELIVTLNPENTEDVCFSGDTVSFLKLATREVDPDTLFFQRKLLVTGDTELGLAIKNFLDDYDLDRLPNYLQVALNNINKFVRCP